MTITIKRRHFKIFTLIVGILLLIFVLFLLFRSETAQSILSGSEASPMANMITESDSEVLPQVPVVPPVAHIATPANVKAIYMSSWIAGVPKLRNRLVDIADETEINAFVIDIKDSTGRVAFKTTDDLINELGSTENRVKDMSAFLEELHKKNIYVIGRISVFQDPYMTSKKPEWAIKKKSDGKVWKDRKGLSFLDPANEQVRDYTVRVALASYAMGFDEINFDYIRYPSDGNLKDIDYQLKEGVKRSDNIETFFTKLSLDVKKDVNIPMSADLFGLTTETDPSDDMGIGQVWEKAIPHFDFVSPMIYPSHYPAGQYGFINPAARPAEVIDRSLRGAIKKTTAMNMPISKIRPWLQDFDMGAKYDAAKVRAQIDSAEKNGITSWMLWDPKNEYTPQALHLEN